MEQNLSLGRDASQSCNKCEEYGDEKDVEMKQDNQRWQMYTKHSL